MLALTVCFTNTLDFFALLLPNDVTSKKIVHLNVGVESFYLCIAFELLIVCFLGLFVADQHTVRNNV